MSKSDNPIFVQVFTRKGVNELILNDFKFKYATVRHVLDYPFKSFEEEEKIATPYDGYYIQPPYRYDSIYHLIDNVKGYKKLFDDKPLLETIIIGRDRGDHSDSILGAIAYEFYIFSDGTIESFIAETSKTKDLLDTYQFKYSDQSRIYYDQYGQPKNINYMHVTNFKVIDDVFINKIISNVKYYEKPVGNNIYKWEVIKDGFIYMVKLPPKNLSDLLQRPQFYIEEYFTKHIKEFPTFLEMTAPNKELHEINHEIANIYIKTVTDATEEDLKKFYYYLVKLILDAGIRLDDEQFKAVFEYLVEADNFIDAKEFRTKLFLQRLGFPMNTSLGFDINIDYETILNFGLLVKELLKL